MQALAANGGEALDQERGGELAMTKSVSRKQAA
jgi:hypothetical protein